MFKNAILYQITSGQMSTPLSTEVDDQIESYRFVECGASQEKSVGWVEPRGEAHGPLVEIVSGQMILKMKVETRAVPGAAVARKARERIAEIEANTGRKPGKKETREIKADIRLELLPMAFSKESTVLVWVDRATNVVLVDAPSQSRADEAVTLLVKSLSGFAVTMINTKVSPTAAMSEWLINQEPTVGFSVDRECELKACDESKAVVKYGRSPLDTDDVKAHILSGKVPTKLALTWDSRVSFVLTDNLQLKKLSFLDVVFESCIKAASEGVDGFDADVAIATGELRKLIPDLVLALGGLFAEPDLFGGCSVN